MKKIVVASTNPVKIHATLSGFQTMFPEETFDVVGISVSSEVSDQPISDNETFQGAMNRLANVTKKVSDADFWVGIEGGIEEKNNEMEAFAWIVVGDIHGKIGKGRTGSFFLPPKVYTLIKQGKELGHATDIVFQMTNSKHSSGAVGALTDNAIDRTAYYIQAVILALVSFKNPELY